MTSSNKFAQSISKKVLITGASSGIGLEFAHLFARDNYDLTLVARNEEKLEKLKKDLEEKYNSNIKIIIADLSKKENSKIVFEKSGPVDVLVNNAGFGLTGEFAKNDLERELDMIELNISSLTALTKLFLPSMLENKSGKILNVASTAAFQPGPFMAVYFATKAYVLHFSEALVVELAGTGVSVTALCPGPTKTNFEKTAGRNDFFKGKILTAKRVAEIGYQAMKKNKTFIITGTKNKVLIWLNRLTPRNIVAKIVGKLIK